LLIRHGEKPSNGNQGIDEQGHVNPDGLTTKGWARAGALTALFAPNNTTLHSALPMPDALVTPVYHGPVHRPSLTLLPLAQRLNKAILSRHRINDDPGMIADDLLAMKEGVVLVCWEHDHLVDIAAALAAKVGVVNRGDIPASWPDDRFDIIWQFGRDKQTGVWTFTELAQQLLAGDVGSV
jgi:hypothetical protein